MKLTIWDDPSDPFDYNELKDNFQKIDAHDHSDGKGVKIDYTGIQNNAIRRAHIQAGAVNTEKIDIKSVTGGPSGSIALDTIEGVNIKPSTISLANLDFNLQSTIASNAIITNDTSVLPTSTNAGREIYQPIESGSRLYWHLKEIGPLTPANDAGGWGFLGGTPLYKLDTADINISRSSFTGSSNGLKVSLPLKGEYRVEYSVTGKYNASTTADYSFGVGLMANEAIISESGVYTSMATSESGNGSEWGTATGFFNVTVQNTNLAVQSIGLNIIRTSGPSPLQVTCNSISITPIRVWS